MVINPERFYEDLDAPDAEDAKNLNGGERTETRADWGGPCLTLAQWAARKIPKRDLLLGSVFSTTTRSLLSADTGLGKTHLGFAIGIHMAGGQDFCHWKAQRPARVLVVDGEMSSELVKERLADAERRLGFRPEGFRCLCKEDVEDMPPLDTEEGQRWLDGLIAHLEGVDFLTLDNIMSLTVGNLKEEEDWRLVLPWLRSLTKRRIGTLSVNHTGHDTTRDYGTKTRTWQMDTVMVGTKIERPEADIAFKLDFVKCRQRTPANRADYEAVNFILADDTWYTEPAEKSGPKTKAPPQGYRRSLEVLNNLLVDAEPITPSRDHVKIRAVQLSTWRKALVSEGILTADEKGTLDSTQRTRLSNIKRHGIDADAMRFANDWIWRP
jgi:hypothetical protein